MLSKKNIQNIENNHVFGNTTWSHQNTYVKTLIAGCMNQAKRIVEKYDEILYGPAPEVLVNDTHSTIRALLKSPGCRSFIDGGNDREEQSADAGDEFVRKIMEAVSPIFASCAEK